VTHRTMISFFNDTDVAADDPRIAAAQYFGTCGFFSDFDAHLDQPLTRGIADLWRDGFAQLRRGELDPQALARRIHQARSSAGEPTGRTRGEVLVEMFNQLQSQ